MGMIDFKAIAIGAALGAVTTKAMGADYMKGAAAGAVAAAFGPWIASKLTMYPNKAAEAAAVAAAAPK